jgi:predicted nucleotidyltransferase
MRFSANFIICLRHGARNSNKIRLLIAMLRNHIFEFLAYVTEGLRKAVHCHQLIQWAGSPVRIQGSFTYGLQTEKSDVDIFVVIEGSDFIDREHRIFHVFEETLLRSDFSTQVGDIYRDTSYQTTWVDSLEGLPVSLKLERVAAASEQQISVLI